LVSSVKERKKKSRESCRAERAKSSHAVRPRKAGVASSAKQTGQTLPSTSTAISKPAASAYNSVHETTKVQKLTEFLEKQPMPGEDQNTSAWMLSLINAVSGNEQATNDDSIAAAQHHGLSADPPRNELSKSEGPSPDAATASADGQAKRISHLQRGQLRVKKRKKSHSPPHRVATQKEEFFAPDDT